MRLLIMNGFCPMLWGSRCMELQWAMARPPPATAESLRDHENESAALASSRTENASAALGQSRPKIPAKVRRDRAGQWHQRCPRRRTALVRPRRFQTHVCQVLRQHVHLRPAALGSNDELCRDPFMRSQSASHGTIFVARTALETMPIASRWGPSSAPSSSLSQK